MDPYELEFEDRGSKKVLELKKGHRHSALWKICTYILGTSATYGQRRSRRHSHFRCDIGTDVDLIPANVAWELELPIYDVVSVMQHLMDLGFLSEPTLACMSVKHYYKGHSVEWTGSCWAYVKVKPLRQHFQGERLPKKVRRNKKELLRRRKHEDKRPLEKIPNRCEWDGKIMTFDATKERIDALKAYMAGPEDPPSGQCERCGEDLGFSGKHSHRSRGHDLQTCNMNAIKNVMEK